MKLALIIFLAFMLLFQLFLIIKIVKKRKLSLRFASLWIAILIFLCFFLLIPDVLFIISNFLGFEETSNMIFLIGFFFLFYMIFLLTSSISVQKEEIKNLVQEISILKSRGDK